MFDVAVNRLETTVFASTSRMAGCELNIAPAFVAAPPAHRLRRNIVTSADDFDASRRRQCAEDDDETEADRAGVIPHCRLVSSAFGPGGGGGEWVTLSKSVLLQLVERICQLSFQTESLSAAAACSSASPPSDRFEASTEMLTDAVKSTDTASPIVDAEQPNHPSPVSLTGTSSDDFPATAQGDAVEVSNNTTTAKDRRDVDDVPTSVAALLASDDTAVIQDRELDLDEATQEATCDDGGTDSDAVTGPVPMQEDDQTTENSSSLADTPPSTSSDAAVPEDVVVSVAAPARRLPVPTTSSLRSTQSLRADRRRRLRELRRLRRRHQAAVAAADEQSHDCSRARRHDAIVRRRFAVPRQPPPRSQDAERHPDGNVTEESVPMRLPAGYRCGRVYQPWSALNKVVICQLVDVVLSQELSPINTTWPSAATSKEKRRSSGTIWNPAITPETRECRTPTPPLTVNSLSSLVSPASADRGSSTLLHSLLSPTMAAAATTYLSRRRSDMSAGVNAELGGGSLAWTMTQASSMRRRHHSAAAPDAFRAPWTPPPPSFFWYNVPPSRGSFVLLPDAASRPCYRWISPTLPPPTSAAADAVCPLDYCTRTLEAGGCADPVDNEACEAPAPTLAGRADLPRRRSSRPSTPSAGRRGTSGAQLKWVVVNKTDVCSLFESLASSMVTDSGDEMRASDESGSHPTTDRGTLDTDQASRAANAAGAEPIKWKSTLLRRAQAEAQTPKHSGSDADVAESSRLLFHVD